MTWGRFLQNIPVAAFGVPGWLGKVVSGLVRLHDRLVRVTLREWFLMFAGIGIVVQLVLIGVSYAEKEEETVRGLWQCAEKIASMEKRNIVLIRPPERASGAAVFYLGRTVEERRDIKLAAKPELWILRHRWPDKYREDDRHRMFRMPEEFDQLKKLISKP